MDSNDFSYRVRVLADQLVKLSMEEFRDLLVYLRETHNIHISGHFGDPPVMQGGGVCKEYPFDVQLESFSNKIPTIKLVRQYTSLGLKEAKDLVDSVESTPRKLGLHVDRHNADHIVREFASISASARIVEI